MEVFIARSLVEMDCICFSCAIFVGLIHHWVKHCFLLSNCPNVRILWLAQLNPNRYRKIRRLVHLICHEVLYRQNPALLAQLDLTLFCISFLQLLSILTEYIVNMGLVHMIVANIAI